MSLWVLLSVVQEPQESQEVLEMLADVATLAPAFILHDLNNTLALMVKVRLTTIRQTDRQTTLLRLPPPSCR